MLVATVLQTALASSWVVSFLLLGRPWRWALLGLLAVASVAYACWRRALPRPTSAPLALAALFLAVAVASAAWSVDPRLTLGRALSFAAVVVTGIALAVAAAGRPRVVGRLLDALLAAAVVVTALGFALYLSYPDRAVQPADTQSPSRYMGLGENPNTVPLLCAVALPIALWMLLAGATPARRIAGAAAGLLLDGTIAASGSRGAMVAATVGLGFVALSAPLARLGRVAVAAGVLALLALNVAVAAIPDAAPAPRRSTPAPGRPAPPPPKDAQRTQPLEDELGGGTQPYRRSLLGTSGRIDAWRGALEQAGERPAAGYGFGTEDTVFVDRYRNFRSALTENSFIGLALQLGVAGVLLLVALVAALLRVAVRALRDTADPAAAACTGVLLAGVTLALTQSYLTSAGNIACLTLWLCAFLGTSLAPRAQPAPPPRA